MGKRKTTEEFITDAIKVHGDKYDYSLVEYISAHNNVIIKCKIHGNFTQEANNHLHGCGCDICGKIKIANTQRKSNSVFIMDAIAVHGDRYDYSFVKYISTHSIINIRCIDHNFIFKQQPANHLCGQGCPKCSSEASAIKQSNKAKDEFIQKAIIIHNGKYDYSLAEYITAHTNVNIICNIHGKFPQSPTSHLNGNGCPICGNIVQGINKSARYKAIFSKRANIIHNDKYDYSLVEYISAKQDVNIICKIHGIFPQAPSNHLCGSGCPSCAKYGFDSSKPAYHYYIRFDRPNYNSLYKVGITNLTPLKRLNGMKVFKCWNPTILQELYFENGQDALDLERHNKQTYKEFQYRGNKIMQNGNSELFIKDILNEDSK